MFAKNLTIAMSLLLLTFAFHPLANAQIQAVTLHLDAFLCGVECANHIQSVMNTYGKDIEDVDVDHEKRRVTLFPNPKERLDLYEIRRELQNAGHSPWKIEVTVIGEVTDYTKTYSGGHIHPRKALKIKETGQQFVLKEGEQLDKLLKTGHKKVRIFGEVPALLEKGLPLLVIKDFEEAKKAQVADEKSK